MSSSNEPKEPNTGHNYDGIEELDNQLPRWWLGTLYATIVFSAFYFAYYVLGEGPTLVKEYERSQQTAIYEAYLRGDNKKVVPEGELQAIFKNSDRRKEGQSVFSARCVACHGDHAQGGIGPNLTDDFWLHGARGTDLVRTIEKGITDKGMPPWGSMLKDTEIQSVAAYIHSVRGTRPAGAKAPQGEKVTLAE
jgi:cytochrome c oxidase cbb3-type subunit III